MSAGWLSEPAVAWFSPPGVSRMLGTREVKITSWVSAPMIPVCNGTSGPPVCVGSVVPVVLVVLLVLLVVLEVIPPPVPVPLVGVVVVVWVVVVVAVVV